MLSLQCVLLCDACRRCCHQQQVLLLLLACVAARWMGPEGPSHAGALVREEADCDTPPMHGHTACLPVWQASPCSAAMQ